jgi:hypothetical protein
MLDGMEVRIRYTSPSFEDILDLFPTTTEQSLTSLFILQLARYVLSLAFSETQHVDIKYSAALQPLTGRIYMNFNTKVAILQTHQISSVLTPSSGPSYASSLSSN